MPISRSQLTASAISWREILLVGLLGLLLYLYVFGPATLNPTHYAWMMKDDPAQHYLGWQFFRNEPWHWPLGHISRIGIPEGTSIVFTDSIPLLALLFKPFSGLLPAEFQYFGLWILACYLLTGFYALRLAGHFIDSPAQRVVVACFFLLSPPLHLRGYGHEALMAQWLLLAGMDVYLGGWQWRRWLALVLVAALVHPYLLLMTLGLLFAANVQALWLTHNPRPKTLAWQNLVIFIALTVTIAAAGHIGSGRAMAGEGYGFFSMNMASLLSPVLSGSRFFRDFATATEGQYEGFVYLGAGVIFLGIMALAFSLPRRQEIQPPSQLRQPAQFLPRLIWPLAIVAFVFWLLALSNHVTLLESSLFTVPLPDAVLNLLSVFRASGRFGWPAFYLLTLGILVVVSRCLPARLALGVLIAALVLQIGDLSGQHRKLRNLIRTRAQWVTPLQSPQWTVLAARADTLLILPPHPAMEIIYMPFAHLAATHGLATNAAHTARVDPARIQAFGQGIAKALAQGGYNPRTLYVMPQREGIANVPPALVGSIIELDGYFVLPPGLPRP